MKIRSLLFIVFVLSIALSVRAEVPGFKHPDVKTLTMEAEMHQQVLDGSDVVVLGSTRKEKRYWYKTHLDIAGSRFVELWKEGEEQPKDYSKPDFIRVVADGRFEFIDHSEKRVTISTVQPHEFPNFLSASKGRVFQGVDLMTLYKKLEGRAITATDDGMRIVSFERPEIPVPARFTIDKNNRVTRIESGSSREVTTDLIEWQETGEIKFPYPAHILSQTQARYVLHEENWIRAIQLNPVFPDTLFDVSYPDDYKVHDVSKLLSAPQF